MRSRSRCLLDKSLDAMLAAIEVYNKPRFPYRNEAFAVLAINAWELVLKARLLQLGDNKLGVIIAKERRKRADGTPSTQRYIKRNRAGNPMSISLFRAYDRIANDFGATLAQPLRYNLEALCEIRDNSVHFMNESPDTELRVNEIGSAAVKNYVNVTRQWFGVDFSQYNLSLMPIAFMRPFAKADAIILSKEEQKFVDYIADAVGQDDEGEDYNVALRIEVQLKRSKEPSAAKFVLSKDPDATRIKIEEEDIRSTYPWDYKVLSTRLKKKYPDFKQDMTYHRIRRELEKDSRYANERLLDPGNPRSSKKVFYSPNILNAFDEHYRSA